MEHVGSYETSEKVALFSRSECSTRRFVVHYSKAIFYTSFWKAFAVVLQEMELICRNGKRDSVAKLTSAEFCLRTIYPNGEPSGLRV